MRYFYAMDDIVSLCALPICPACLPSPSAIASRPPATAGSLPCRQHVRLCCGSSRAATASSLSAHRAPAHRAVPAVPQVHDLDVLHADLEEAVSAEDYRTAAALKKQQTALEEADCLGAALDELDAAVADERFAGGCLAGCGWVVRWVDGWLLLAVGADVVGQVGLPSAIVSSSCCAAAHQPLPLLRPGVFLPLQTRPACATSLAWACRAGGWGAARGTAWATCCG